MHIDDISRRSFWLVELAKTNVTKYVHVIWCLKQALKYLWCQGDGYYLKITIKLTKWKE